MQSLQQKVAEWSGVAPEDAFAIDGTNLYLKLGHQTFVDLSTGFYNKVYADDKQWFQSIFANSRKEDAIQNQYEFFIQRMGSPPLYSQRKGHPALIMRHKPFPVTREAAERWLQHMEKALDSVSKITRCGFVEYYNSWICPKWALTVLGYLARLILGIFGFIVSVAWVAHIVLYMLINPPVTPFLNEVFIKIDSVWGLFGTVAFAFFCLYLLLAVIAGAMVLGLRLVFITIHPMKWGGTLMNSFLFNAGLILLCSISVIQFCSTAFAVYAQATAAQEIFGRTLESLRGI